MRILFDENISPRLVRALASNASLKRGDSLISIYDTSLTSAEDETWLEKYSDDGGTYFVSGDRDMLQRPTLLSIIMEHRMVGFFFRKEFAQQTRLRQLSYAAFWWHRIQTDFEGYQPGSAWLTPNNYSDSPLKSVQIEKALQKRSKLP